MDRRAHFVLRTAAIAVVVIEMLVPRGATSKPAVDTASVAPAHVQPEQTLAPVAMAGVQGST